LIFRAGASRLLRIGSVAIMTIAGRGQQETVA
jgi:hypothetical protein